MRLKVAVQNVPRNSILAGLNTQEVLARSISTDAAVGSRRKRGFVYDRVAASGLNAMIAAPLLWKDMMNVDALVEVVLYGRLFASHPIARAFAQQERIYALVRGTVSRAQR